MKAFQIEHEDILVLMNYLVDTVRTDSAIYKFCLILGKLLDQVYSKQSQTNQSNFGLKYLSIYYDILVLQFNF